MKFQELIDELAAFTASAAAIDAGAQQIVTATHTALLQTQQQLMRFALDKVQSAKDSEKKLAKKGIHRSREQLLADLTASGQQQATLVAPGIYEDFNKLLARLKEAEKTAGPNAKKYSALIAGVDGTCRRLTIRDEQRTLIADLSEFIANNYTSTFRAVAASKASPGRQRQAQNLTAEFRTRTLRAGASSGPGSAFSANAVPATRQRAQTIFGSSAVATSPSKKQKLGAAGPQEQKRDDTTGAPAVQLRRVQSFGTPSLPPSDLSQHRLFNRRRPEADSNAAAISSSAPPVMQTPRSALADSLTSLTVASPAHSAAARQRKSPKRSHAQLTSGDAATTDSGVTAMDTDQPASLSPKALTFNNGES